MADKIFPNPWQDPKVLVDYIQHLQRNNLVQGNHVRAAVRELLLTDVFDKNGNGKIDENEEGQINQLLESLNDPLIPKQLAKEIRDAIQEELNKKIEAPIVPPANVAKLKWILLLQGNKIDLTEMMNKDPLVTRARILSTWQTVHLQELYRPSWNKFKGKPIDIDPAHLDKLYGDGLSNVKKKNGDKQLTLEDEGRLITKEFFDNEIGPKTFWNPKGKGIVTTDEWLALGKRAKELDEGDREKFLKGVYEGFVKEMGKGTPQQRREFMDFLAGFRGNSDFSGLGKEMEGLVHKMCDELANHARHSFAELQKYTVVGHFGGNLFYNDPNAGTFAYVYHEGKLHFIAGEESKAACRMMYRLKAAQGNPPAVPALPGFGEKDNVALK